MNWISVDEKMPEVCKKVLICFGPAPNLPRIIDVAWFDSGLWWLTSKCALDRLSDNVSHWMPLPEPPSNITPDAADGGYCSHCEMNTVYDGCCINCATPV